MTDDRPSPVDVPDRAESIRRFDRRFNAGFVAATALAALALAWVTDGQDPMIYVLVAESITLLAISCFILRAGAR